MTLFGITVAVIVAIVVASASCASPRTAAGRWPGWIGGPGCARWWRLARRVKPQARFLLNRLTPGELGLELTAMLAVLSVAVFILIGYAGIVSADPGPDRRRTQAAFDIDADLDLGMADRPREGRHWLWARPAATLVVGLIAAAVLAARRRWTLAGGARRRRWSPSTSPCRC